MKIFKPFIIYGFTLITVTWLIPTVEVTNLYSLLLFTVIFTILKKIIRPILKILFLPINIVTLGLFSWIINVGLLWTATFLVPGFTIIPTSIYGTNLNLFFTLALISFLISLIYGILNKVL